MIISVSRRTDVPAYYADWFFNRLKAQEVLVRNPINKHQVSRLSLTPEQVECFVFWTKDPEPMLGRLDELKDYPFYFQITLNAYGEDVEPHFFSGESRRIEVFKRLSDKIGPERVIWRYDPILFNARYTMDYHVERFGKLAGQLKDYTEKCTISFMDFYPKIKSNIKFLEISPISPVEERRIARQLAEITAQNGLKLNTCAEEIDLDEFGITPAKCVDDALITRISGRPVKAPKDKNQRLACGCVASVDIGLYNTCPSGCKYCYANHRVATIQKNIKENEADSPLLCSHIGPGDVVRERRPVS